MGLEDKFQEAVGKAKEAVSGATGNEELRSVGQKDRAAGSIGQIVDEAKEKLGDAKEAVTDKIEEVKDKLTGK